ncbi:MAG: hypothetical protein O9302_05495 [Cyclobacteriaceae bacterium]|jgi:hypothetical protein|nr:hypothetical protein [Flammeovirgaceae bacterium]MCZ8022408.1 hypothetical protein [Cytophagales bacterium]MCZ8327492.1 hypothetical protein [Cyclobacteriaceae bacterium]
MIFRIIQPIILSVTVAAILILPTTAKFPANNQPLAELPGENKTVYTLNDSTQTDSIRYSLIYISEKENILELLAENFSIRFQVNEPLKQNTNYVLDNPGKRLATVNVDNLCYATTDEYYTGTLLIHKFDKESGSVQGSFEIVVHSATCDSIIRIQDAHFKTRAKISYY